MHSLATVINLHNIKMDGARKRVNALTLSYSYPSPALCEHMFIHRSQKRVPEILELEVQVSM